MQSNRGTGPGAITADGCAVELYAMLPPSGEPQIIASALPDASVVLELGAGAGRITHPLLGLGFRVTAVDDSPDMLARIHGARTVLSTIQSLDLGERFDGVLMMSHLINTAEPADAAALLATCRRHVADGGHVLIQRHPTSWFDQAAATESSRAGMTVRLRDISRPTRGHLRATAIYTIGNATWTHTFTTRRVDDAELARLLSAAELRLERFLTDDGAWISAIPA